ncbi:MAG: epoxyalkane--coenzyme M transferase [Gammaproteobacteria bacterium]
MQLSTHRTLCTHVGSLPRPAALSDLLDARQRGEPVQEGVLGTAADAAVRAAVARQCELGLDVVNDGEQGKFSYMAYHVERLSGFEPREVPGNGAAAIAAEAADFPEFYARHYATRGGAVRRHACTGPIAYRGAAAVAEDIARLKAAVQGRPHAGLFLTAISPGMMKLAPNEHYPDRRDYLHALCDAMREEYRAIVDAGVVLQVDCPDLGIHPRVQACDLPAHRREIAENVDLLNYATRGLPAERIRIHVCCGADEAPHHRDPDLVRIVDLLLAAHPAGMTLVGANGRHAHEWRVWEQVPLPAGKVIIAGVVDNTTNIIEHPEAVAERIVRLAGVIGRENVVAGVDCGFETIAGVSAHRVDPLVAWAKLGALVEGARIASRRLFG